LPPISVVSIASKRQLNVKLYQNYLALDDSFYKVYNVLRNYGTSKYAPFAPLLKDLNTAFEKLKFDDPVAQNFPAFLRINETVRVLSEYGIIMFSEMTDSEESTSPMSPPA
jgi:hypothetical protein